MSQSFTFKKPAVLFTFEQERHPSADPGLIAGSLPMVAKRKQTPQILSLTAPTNIVRPSLSPVESKNCVPKPIWLGD
jgi:hypothetical protein